MQIISENKYPVQFRLGYKSLPVITKVILAGYKMLLATLPPTLVASDLERSLPPPVGWEVQTL